MHEAVMSISIPWSLFGRRPFAPAQTRKHWQVFFQNRSVIKNSGMRRRETRPTVQHKSNCAACFLCYRITCWWDDGSLSPNNTIRTGCMWLRSPVRLRRVNNIIVILERVINYDHAILIIKQVMLHSAPKNFLDFEHMTSQKVMLPKVSLSGSNNKWFMVKINLHLFILVFFT